MSTAEPCSINDHPAMRKRRWRNQGWTGDATRVCWQGDVGICLPAFACVGEVPMVLLLHRVLPVRRRLNLTRLSHRGMPKSECVGQFVRNQEVDIQVCPYTSAEGQDDAPNFGAQFSLPKVIARDQTFARLSFASDPRLLFPSFKRDPATLATLAIEVTRDNTAGIGNACQLRYCPGRNVFDLSDIICRHACREDEHVRRRGRQPPQDALIYWLSARCARAVVVVERELLPVRIIVVRGRRRGRRRRRSRWQSRTGWRGWSTAAASGGGHHQRCQH